MTSNDANLLEHVTCDLCGSDHYKVRYRKPDIWLWNNSFEYPVVECLNCGLVYVNPRPTYEAMRNFYPTDYHDNRNEQAFITRYHHQYSYISKHDFNNILDIGCARGDWLSYVKEKSECDKLYGIDAFSDGVKDSEIFFYKGQLHQLDLPDEYFEMITSWAVIEHVHTPMKYFDAVQKSLKPGGKFVFLVTNSESIYGKYAYKEDIPRHLYHFNQKSLEKYAEVNNLELLSIEHEPRFWDSSGKGAFVNLMRKLLRISWVDFKDRRFGILTRVLLRVASTLDDLVFTLEWENKIKKSGIIVITMKKPIL